MGIPWVLPPIQSAMGLYYSTSELWAKRFRAGFGELGLLPSLVLAVVLVPPGNPEPLYWAFK